MIHSFETSEGREVIPLDIDTLHAWRYKPHPNKTVGAIMTARILPLRNNPEIMKRPYKYFFFVEQLLQRLRDPSLQEELRRNLLDNGKSSDS
ncbi:MAG: hypothetical protein COT15_02680 [Candidatus Diapherotrites archaeon CG08_land_8_20_14_0_20_34_12]|nr:MAG: hypothetical protein COT15_02680 [Candidatus Diapherotrites archaeon CG08_land_8_20_14_0_20_34_12]